MSRVTIMIIRMKRIAIILALTLSCQLLPADDWPEWRGRGRLGVWKETGILDEFPKQGLTVNWRTPINAGFSGPSVSGGRVVVVVFALLVHLQGQLRRLPPAEKNRPPPPAQHIGGDHHRRQTTLPTTP